MREGSVDGRVSGGGEITQKFEKQYKNRRGVRKGWRGIGLEEMLKSIHKQKQKR
jgi:hypothetical protein